MQPTSSLIYCPKLCHIALFGAQVSWERELCCQVLEQPIKTKTDQNENNSGVLNHLVHQYKKKLNGDRTYVPSFIFPHGQAQPHHWRVGMNQDRPGLSGTWGSPKQKITIVLWTWGEGGVWIRGARSGKVLSQSWGKKCLHSFPNEEISKKRHLG